MNCKIIKITAMFTLVFLFLFSFTARAADYPELKTHWAKDVLIKWNQNGLLSGYSDGTIKPDKTITRAEFVTLINRVFGFYKKAEINFKDVEKNSWYYDEIAKAFAAKIVNGYSDNTFKPNNEITRQEMAAIIGRLVKLNEINDDSLLENFKDKDKVAQWAKGAVCAIVKEGYMNGYTDGTFKPEGKATRAEVIKVLDNAFSYVINKEGVYGKENEKTEYKNVIINRPNVTFKNAVINGNLYLAHGIGEGEVVLENVVVKGKTLVFGGGQNSIIIKDSNLGYVTIEKEGGNIRIAIQGKTVIENMELNSGAKIEAENTQEAVVKNVFVATEEKAVIATQVETLKVETEGVKIEIANGTITNLFISEQVKNVELVALEKVEIKNVEVKAESAQVVVQNTVIENLVVAETAKETKLVLAGDVVVKTVEVNAKANIEGQGTIEKAVVKANEVVIEQKVKNVVVENDVKAVVGGTEVTSTTQSQPQKSETGGSGGGGGTGGGSTGGGPSTPTTYTITATAGEGGTITPSGEIAVANGGSKEFTITANSGYKISQVLVDSSPIEITNDTTMTYTFSNIKEKHTIEARFVDLTQPTMKILTATFEGGKVITSTDGKLTCNLGDKVTSIKVEVSEPVEVVGTPIVKVNLGNGYVRYGVLSLDNSDTTKKTLIVTPDTGNEVCGLVGTFTFKVAAGAVKDIAGNENEEVTFTLNVVDNTDYTLKSFKIAANFIWYNEQRTFEKLYSGDIPDNITIHIPYIEEFHENNNLIGKYLTLDNYNIEEIVTKDPNTYAEIVKDFNNNEIKINVKNKYTNKIGKVYTIKFDTVPYYHFGTIENNEIRTLIGGPYKEGEIKLSDLINSGDVKLELELWETLPDDLNVIFVVYDKNNNEKQRMIFNNESKIQYLDIRDYVYGEKIEIPYRLYYDKDTIEDNVYFDKFSAYLIDTKALPERISSGEGLLIYFQKPKYTIEISGPNDVKVNEYKDINVYLYCDLENRGEFGYINPKMKIEVEKPEGIAEDTVEIFAPGTVIKENRIWYWEPWREGGNQNTFILKDYNPNTNISVSFKEAGQCKIKFTLVDTQNNDAEITSNEIEINVTAVQNEIYIEPDIKINNNFSFKKVETLPVPEDFSENILEEIKPIEITIKGIGSGNPYNNVSMRAMVVNENFEPYNDVQLWVYNEEAGWIDIAQKYDENSNWYNIGNLGAETTVTMYIYPIIKDYGNYQIQFELWEEPINSHKFLIISKNVNYSFREYPEFNIANLDSFVSFAIEPYFENNYKNQDELNRLMNELSAGYSPINLKIQPIFMSDYGDIISEKNYKSARIVIEYVYEIDGENYVPGEDKLMLFTKDTAGDWENIITNGWGPQEGIALFSGEEITLPIHVIVKKPGKYIVKTKLYDLNTNKTIDEKFIELTLNAHSLYKMGFDWGDNLIINKGLIKENEIKTILTSNNILPIKLIIESDPNCLGNLPYNGAVVEVKAYQEAGENNWVLANEKVQVWLKDNDQWYNLIGYEFQINEEIAPNYINYWDVYIAVAESGRFKIEGNLYGKDGESKIDLSLTWFDFWIDEHSQYEIELLDNITFYSGDLLPENNGIPISNEIVEQFVYDKTPINITLKTVKEGLLGYDAVRMTVSVEVYDENYGWTDASEKIQLWAKDTAGNWYNIVETGWGPLNGFELPAVYESTTQVYIICNIEGLFRVNINLIDVKENISILTKESLYIMGSFNGE
ncbi:S-layer homology domain-containing protein [Thermovenabulum sp.]|uniref:S-layer homology domain-containing protein n=1 Tax=Thermovenabulum sp. TaxID=3100335 RepID=UPI003C7E8625